MPSMTFDNLYKISFTATGILYIRTAAELDAFTEIYGGTPGWRWGDAISWKQVSKRYSGIEICPFIRARASSRNAGWYGGWDVASGCIWDTSIITKVEEVLL